MCGADTPWKWTNEQARGSPPRVRSRPVQQVELAGIRGITSACAEQTKLIFIKPFPQKDHLRVCGADPKVYAAIHSP